MKHIRHALLPILLMFNVHAAFADTIIAETNGPNNSTNGSWVFSDTFTANTNSVIDSLGYYDNNDTNQDSHMVGLYDSQGNLLASANIAAGNDYSNNFDWENISSISLTAGQTYTIAGVSNADVYGYFGVPSTSNLFTFVSSQYNSSTVLNDPLVTNGNDYFSGSNTLFNGPNAVIQAVPEPASLYLAALGLLAVVATRRRAKQK